MTASIVPELLQKILTISVFVSVMMLVVEYLNVRTGGSFAKLLQGSRWRQYVLAALLGASPGCLGAFVLVTLHVQRSITLGALVAGMIATSGDEIFVMLAMIPKTALIMMLALIAIGILAGFATDTLVGKVTHINHDDCCRFIESHTADCRCQPEAGVLALWRPPKPERAFVFIVLFVFALSLITGWVGSEEWDWERIAFLVVACLGLVIVTTASDQFFKEHFWAHVARKHIPPLVLWTTGALIAIAVVDHFADIGAMVSENRWGVLLVASLVGVIPESGPHLVFVSLFAQGSAPLSVLFASSIVQDGHGMLPLLAHSRRDFFLVKGINLFVGLLVGAAMMAFGH